MKGTVIFIQGHFEANEMIARHMPYWEKADCDLVGIGRTDKKVIWPSSPRLIATHEIGTGGYVEKGKLCERFLGMLDLFVERYSPEGYTDVAIVECDAIFVRPLPRHPLTCSMIATPVGGPFPGFLAPKIWHSPYHIDWHLACNMAACGRRMLAVGLNEKGFYDQWIGLIVALHGITVEPGPFFSCNLIDRPGYVAAARRAIVGGCVYVHGIKTALQLKQVTEGLNIL